MKRYVFTTIIAFLQAITASAQVRVTGRVIDLQNRQSSESHTSLLVYGRVVTEEGKANKPVSDVIVKLVKGYGRRAKHGNAAARRWRSPAATRRASIVWN